MKPLILTALTLIVVACGGTADESDPVGLLEPTPEETPEVTPTPAPSPTEEPCIVPTEDDYLDYVVTFEEFEFQLSLSPCGDLPPTTIRELLEPANECKEDRSYPDVLRLVCSKEGIYMRLVNIDIYNCPAMDNRASYVRYSGGDDDCTSEYLFTVSPPEAD
ncbi:MAG: hypothetical protein Q8S13_07905 [Dehalococcoidia bacterium]|nr:hypothetical protein [Dehalococcoidia bacterium]